MRFQPAAFLAALATGAVATPTAHLKHMQLHAARDAEAIDYNKGVDYNTVDYSGLDWNKILGGGSSTPATAAAAAPTAASTPVVNAVQAKVAAPASSAVHSVAAAAAPSSSAKSSSPLGAVENAIGDFSNLISSLSSNALCLKVASAKSDGSCSEGTNGPYVVEATNNKDSDMLLVIWNSNNGYSSSFVGMGVQAPVMTVAIPKKSKKSISFTSGMSGAMAPVWSSTAPTSFGQISNTWLEFTFSPSGVVDVSREVDMGGDSIQTVVGSTGCKSNMSQCSFQCTNGAQSCKDDYHLVNCAGQNGAQPGDRDGGCGWNGAASDTIQAIFG